MSICEILPLQFRNHVYRYTQWKYSKTLPQMVVLKLKNVEQSLFKRLAAESMNCICSKIIFINISHVLNTITHYIKQKEYEVLLKGIVTECEVLL